MSVRLSRRAPLAAALLLAVATPAFAADPLCRDANGVEIFPPPSTDQGTEAGVDNATCSPNAVAFGRGNLANGGYAFGILNRALGATSSAFGAANWAYGNNSVAFGRYTAAMGGGSAALGYNTTTLGVGSVALGSWFDRNNDGIINVDLDLDGDGEPDTTSEGTLARGRYATAFGAGADAVTDNSVAIGSNSVANRGNAVSVGNATTQRQIVNVAAGTQATDAVNLSQLQATLAQANAYTNTAVATGGTATNAYTDNREAAIRTDMASGDAAALAESKTYTDSTATQTLTSANAYTDQKFNQIVWNDDFLKLEARIEQRFARTDKRINQVSALGTAMTQMAVNASNGNGDKGRLGVGLGYADGEKAVSVGYGKRMGRGSFSLGAAFSGSENTIGAGFGFDL